MRNLFFSISSFFFFIFFSHFLLSYFSMFFHLILVFFLQLFFLKLVLLFFSLANTFSEFKGVRIGQLHTIDQDEHKEQDRENSRRNIS